MNYDKKTIRDIDVSGKKILLRCDFNVPHDKTTGIIHDDTRIVSTLPTIRYLLEHNAAVILLSHMGRPHGQWKKELSLFSARDHLEKLLGIPVPLTQDVLGPDTKEKCAALQPGQVVLVENLRFRLEEEQNDPDFSRELASLADLFVFDAFGAAHRAHASTEGVSHYLPSVAGLLVEKELQFMGAALEAPKRPWWPSWAGPRWPTRSASSKICFRRQIPFSSAAACPTPFWPPRAAPSAPLCWTLTTWTTPGRCWTRHPRWG